MTRLTSGPGWTGSKRRPRGRRAWRRRRPCRRTSPSSMRRAHSDGCWKCLVVAAVRRPVLRLAGNGAPAGTLLAGVQCNRWTAEHRRRRDSERLGGAGGPDKHLIYEGLSRGCGGCGDGWRRNRSWKRDGPFGLPHRRWWVCARRSGCLVTRPRIPRGHHSRHRSRRGHDFERSGHSGCCSPWLRRRHGCSAPSGNRG